MTSPENRRRRRLMRVAAVPLFLFFFPPVVYGQSALDGFDPNANGNVAVVVVQPDGKILLGGSFSTLSPNGGAAVMRYRIARLNPDGTLDAAFDPNVDIAGYVNSIALQPDGKILVGGSFSSIGGQTRNCIARLNPTTGLADSFDPNANGTVWSIAVQADARILIGGQFTTIGGETRNRVARLDAVTGLADSFDPNASGPVYSIAEQMDGKILVSGAFSGANSIGGQTRNHIARLDATTGLADSFDPNANNTVFSIGLQADGKILAGGAFTNVGGQIRTRIARLDPTTGLADSFDPIANNIVLAIAVQPDGNIVAGGAFTSIGGQTRNHIARLDTITGLADSFDPNVSAEVYSIALQPDGKILAGGGFYGPNGVRGQMRNRIARLEIDGRLDQNLNIAVADGYPNYVSATAVQPDGKILIGGRFTSVLGVARNNIARLNTDGTLDQVFDPYADRDVQSIAVQADGKILAGGLFTRIGGELRNRIARLDATTGLVDSFNPNANDQVHSIAVQTDGKVLVAGFYTSIGGQTRNYIARLDATTGLADSFNPNANSVVSSTAVQADGKILAGGFFTNIGGQPRTIIARLDPMAGFADLFDPSPHAGGAIYSIAMQKSLNKIIVAGYFDGIGGQPRNSIARLDLTTGLADSFNPNANSKIYSIGAQADGRILVGGWFSGPNSIGGQMRNYIARLDPATSSADSFDPNANNVVYSVAVQADGKVLASGGFVGPNSIGGEDHGGFARLTNDTAALQNLAVTKDTITWTRAGSSPQFMRVTFEYSVDNVNYGFLGEGTALGSNWTLPGLSLPTSTNIYVRARGYYPSGHFNGSQSITESVRNAFIAEPTSTVAPTASPISTASSTPSSSPMPTPTLTPTPTPTPTPTCDDTWTATSTINAPTGRGLATAEWTDTEMIIWGGTSDGSTGYLNTGGRYNPRTDSWIDTSTIGAPTARVYHTSVWTGNEMVVWGGRNSGNLFNTGGRYHPGTDSWIATSTINAPTARNVSMSVWTGNEMIVWGGEASNGIANTGGRYNPGTDSWTNTSTIGAPMGRYLANVVWTGSEMIVWGGRGASDPFPNTGGRYSPATDTWTPTSTTNAPSGRVASTVVWTGSEMIVWGGVKGNDWFNTGGRYNPSTDTWTPTSTINAPGSRAVHTAIWTGREMIVWGGPTPQGTGGRYDPVSDSWAATTTTNAPVPRTYHTGVWTGSEMIVWGGESNGSNPTFLNTGGRYCAQPPPMATPTPTPTLTPSPTPTPTPSPTPSPTPTPSSTPTPTPSPILVAVVSLPTADIETSVTHFTQPVVTSAINAADNLVGFQGDFTFDSRVITFQSPPVSSAELTSSNWNVSGNVLPGSGPFRTLRISAFSNNFTPLSGSGALYNLNMTRVSSTPGASTTLAWKPEPDDFFFIDYDLNTNAPGSAPPGSVTIQAPAISISGSISYCSNPVPDPVPNVTLTMTGTSGASTLSDGSGHYTFSSLPSGGNYTVALSMAALPPGSAGINTLDVLAAQRHYLTVALIPPGCGRDAGDVTGDGRIDTSDVVAIQRFFLGRIFGTANVGNYRFTPANHSYPGITSNQAGQDYVALVFGDIVAGFVQRPEDPQNEAAEGTSAGEIPAAVATVALPEIAVDQSTTKFLAAVATSPIDEKNRLVGFQGDFTFDERVVTFQSEPVQKAGLTAGNWNVSGNVLPGASPIRTLRISAFSNDLAPLSGSGALFELRMTKVSQAAQGSSLIWAAPPDQFIFIDADLHTRKSGTAPPSCVVPIGQYNTRN